MVSIFTLKKKVDMLNIVHNCMHKDKLDFKECIEFFFF